jgi:phosphopantothenoylcysteine decarboxylase / phosphopantothenate---cysteine ligase
VDFGNQTLVLGIAGGVAAYRACDFIREAQRRGMGRIIPVLTETASEFVSPLTLSALAKETALSDPLSVDAHGVPWHIALAQQGDALLVLPATADLMAKMAMGLADNLLLATLLTFAEKPVLLAPAMNTRMWEHPLTQRNLATLEALDFVTLATPNAGLLACGETGMGHLASNEAILWQLYRLIHPCGQPFKGVKALVTTGGTHEPLDPVRSLCNASSGKMGQALADELYGMGAEVTLVSARSEMPERPYLQIPVTTVSQMYEALMLHFSQANLIIKTAAVSDYQPEVISPVKLKKNKAGEAPLHLTLVPTLDILKTLGQQKQTPQVLVGFAAETHNGEGYAQQKLQDKHLDLIVLNDVSRSDIGFQADENEVTLFYKSGRTLTLEKQPKWSIARHLLLDLEKQYFQ